MAVDLSPAPTLGQHALSIPESLIDEVREQAQWVTTPTHVSGRSAHLMLADGLRTRWGTVHVMRCKGIAWTDDTGNVLPPSETSWFSDGRTPWLACRVDPDGTVHGIPAEDRASGAMPLARVDQEMAGTLQASAAGIATSLPLLRGRYPHLSFAGEPLGFLVFGEPGLITRLGTVINHNHENLPATSSLLAAVGATLRQLHRTGMVNLSPHLGNFSIVDPADAASGTGDNSSRQLPTIRVHDLDRWDDANTMSPSQATGYRLRDLAVLGWSLAGRTYQSRWRAHRHVLARHVMGGYLGDHNAVDNIAAVELIRFVGLLRNGGNVNDLPGRWASAVAESLADDTPTGGPQPQPAGPQPI